MITSSDLLLYYSSKESACIWVHNNKNIFLIQRPIQIIVMRHFTMETFVNFTLEFIKKTILLLKHAVVTTKINYMLSLKIDK